MKSAVSVILKKLILLKELIEREGKMDTYFLWYTSHTQISQKPDYKILLEHIKQLRSAKDNVIFLREDILRGYNSLYSWLRNGD